MSARNLESLSPSPHVGAVRDYFTERAATYQDSSLQWPWSALRAREAAAVSRMMGAFEGAEILEMGCGAGFYTRMMLAAGARHVTATDLVETMVAQLPGDRVTGVVGDAASVSLGRRFDRLLVAGLLEFVPDAGAVLRNARAHATDAARLVVLAPRQSLIGLLYRRFHAGHGIAARLFAGDELEALASSAGWQLEVVERILPFTMVLRLVAQEDGQIGCG